MSRKLLATLALALSGCFSAAVVPRIEMQVEPRADACPIVILDDAGAVFLGEAETAEFRFPDIRRIGHEDPLACPVDQVGHIDANWSVDRSTLWTQLLLADQPPGLDRLTEEAKKMGGDALRKPRVSSSWNHDTDYETYQLAGATVVRFRNPACRCAVAWAWNLAPRQLLPSDVVIASAGDSVLTGAERLGRIAIHGARPGGRASAVELVRLLAAEMGGDRVIPDAGADFDDLAWVPTDSLWFGATVLRSDGVDEAQPASPAGLNRK